MQVGINAFLTLLLSLGLTVNVFAETPFESDKLHTPFNEVLRAYVGNGNVNYSGIKDDARFGDYLHALKQARPDTFATKAEKLAFWINTYNALAIKGILDGLSPDSFFGRITYFKTTDYELAGQSVNLYDLERDIIIPFNEPRIHFAIVCASLSCPKLRSEAYLAASLEQQLNDNAIDFINDPQKNRFDGVNKRAHLSKIFDWYEDDFGDISKFASQYMPALKGVDLDSISVEHSSYDWKLNKTR